MSELQKELDKDQAFINEVHERIYCESDDWEDSIAEPEWIVQMTDIADKYLRRFKASELNENQEIVLEWLKRQGRKNVIGIVYKLNCCNAPESVCMAFVRLSDLEQTEVLQAFATWALDQC